MINKDDRNDRKRVENPQISDVPMKTAIIEIDDDGDIKI